MDRAFALSRHNPDMAGVPQAVRPVFCRLPAVEGVNEKEGSRRNLPELSGKNVIVLRNKSDILDVYRTTT